MDFITIKYVIHLCVINFDTWPYITLRCNLIIIMGLNILHKVWLTKTHYNKLAKLYAKYFGHMTKMAATPIYGKNLLKIFFSRTRRQMTLRLGM